MKISFPCQSGWAVTRRLFLVHSLPAVLAPVLGLGMAAVAADPVNPATGNSIDEEIVVTATRSPYSLADSPVSVRVISADDIVNSGAGSVEQMLRGVGTLQIRDSVGNGRDVRINIRGLAAGQNALVLVDGRRINNSDLSEPDLTAITLQDVGRIEVLEGGAGVLFGDQAVGGVVNIITDQGQKQGGRATLGLGSYDAQNLKLAYGRSTGNGLGYRISAQQDDSDGYRELAALDYRNYRGELNYAYGRGNRAFVEWQKSDNEYLLPGALLGPELEADRRQAGAGFNDYNQATESFRIGLQHSFAGSAQVLANYMDRDEKVLINGRSLAFGDSTTQQTREVVGIDPRLVLVTGAMRWTLGADLEDYDYEIAVDSALGSSRSQHQHRRRSEYGQAILSLGDAVKLSAGQRHATVDVDVDAGFFTADYDDSLNARQLGASWLVNNRWRIYGGWEQTFRFPLPDENVDFLGNLVELDPQRGEAWELGSSWRAGPTLWRLTMFRHAIEDEIGFDSEAFSNVNFDDSLRQGISVDCDWQLGDRWQAVFGFSRMSAKFDEGPLAGNRLPGVAEQLARLTLNYAPDDAWNIWVEGLYTGSVAVAMATDSPVLGGYAVYNLAVGYAWGDWQFRGRINNITGKQYSELVTDFGQTAFYPSPEQNATLAIEYSF